MALELLRQLRPSEVVQGTQVCSEPLETNANET